MQLQENSSRHLPRQTNHSDCLQNVKYFYNLSISHLYLHSKLKKKIKIIEIKPSNIVALWHIF
nr:MAG TPA: hypothetical protein [Caudoviricetes sp.]